MSVPLSIIVAVADNGVIGRDNQLIWRLRSDLQRFKALTLGRPMVMGRKTYQSIGKPLPGRETIVVTRDPAFRPDGVMTAADLDAALTLAQDRAKALGADSVPVVGGGEIYRQAMPAADLIRLTRVHCAPEGDTRFPDPDPALFVETGRESHPAGPHDEFSFTFIDYSRRPRDEGPRQS
jgi:dihydrofolate reductase